MVSTKNFNLKSDPKLACTCGHPDCNKPVVKQSVLDQLQKIREDYGQPMIVTSGARCKHHPNEAAKKQAGDHQLLMAVDVYYKGETMLTKLLVLAGRHGCTRVAYGSNFIHMAWTETDRKDVPTWRY